MKKLIVMMVAICFLPFAVLAQTVVLRKIVTTGTGTDQAPQIVRASDGKYVVTWLREVNGNESRTYGRLVDLNGNFGSPIKSNILGATIYKFSAYDLATLPAGGFLLVGTRNSDRQVVSRFFNGNFAASGALAPSGVVGYNPTIAVATSGFLLGQGDGGGLSFWTRLDSHAHKLSDQTPLHGSTPSNGFTIAQVLPLPAGDFLLFGYEKNAAGNGRAAGYNMPASLSSVSPIIPYETAFVSNLLNIDAAADSTGGFTLFGHVINSSKTAGKLRPINSTGHPSAGAKAYPVGIPNVFARNYRVISLTGAGKFVVSWEDPGAGFIYLRLFNSHGVPIGAAVPLAPDPYQYPGGIGDLAWDEATQTLLAVWTQYTSTGAKTNIWLGVFRVS